MIRKITKEDLDFMMTWDKEDTFTASLDCHDNPFAIQLVDEEAKDVLGYLNYSLLYDRIELNMIYVRRDKRGKKVGSQLLRYLIEQAIENHCVNITLEVRESNQVAHKLYQKNGFEIVTIRKNYYGNENGLLMIKQIEGEQCQHIF